MGYICFDNQPIHIMNETKTCPYCGEEILLGAKKCKHCGEWMEKPVETVHSDEMDSLPDIHFKTKDLKWWQKLMQMYWFNPKSWLLDEFDVKGDSIKVKLKNGDVVTWPFSELKVRMQADKYDRKEVYLTCGEKKIHFREIPFMLEDEQWEAIFEFLESVDDIKETTLNKINKVLKKAVEIGNDIL